MEKEGTIEELEASVATYDGPADSTGLLLTHVTLAKLYAKKSAETEERDDKKAPLHDAKRHLRAALKEEGRLYSMASENDTQHSMHNLLKPYSTELAGVQTDIWGQYTRVYGSEAAEKAKELTHQGLDYLTEKIGREKVAHATATAKVYRDAAAERLGTAADKTREYGHKALDGAENLADKVSESAGRFSAWIAKLNHKKEE